MLTKTNRLSGAKNFALIFRRGKGSKEDSLFLKFAPNNLEQSRLAIVVPQKVSKKATVRNKIRRRISAIAQSRLPKTKRGLDIIVTALPGLEKKNFQELTETVDRLFQKAKIIKQINDKFFDRRI